jgi:hypothetical protein
MRPPSTFPAPLVPNATSEGHRYADRETGAAYATPFAMIDAYLSRWAERAGSGPAHLDPTGYAQLRHGAVSVGVNVLEEAGTLMILAPVMEVPVERREPFYRRLLELSFLQTADASFAIDGKSGQVYARAIRRLSGLDYEEFADLLEIVGAAAEDGEAKLRGEFGA